MARYLRVPPCLALAFIERERMPPHPEWLLHHCWGRMGPPFLFLDDAPAFPDLPEGPPRISFRRFADLYVRTFAVQAIAEWWRSSPPGKGERGLPRAFWRTIEDLAHEHELFGEGGVDAGVARLIERLGREPDEIDRGWLEKWLRLRLERVELKEGVPVRLFPFSRDPAEGSPRTVVMDPQIRSGRPMVMGRGTPTDILFARHQAGDSIAEMAEDYGLTPDEVEEAIRFEAAK